MKKIYLFFIAVACAFAANAQMLPNASFENWRTQPTGSTTIQFITAPDAWYGADSLIIADGEALGGGILGIPDSVWQRQLFKDSVNVHSGTYSAKLVTVYQDTLGIFPGVLSNAQANVSIDFSTLAFNFYYTGGTAVTNRTKTVSAWVKYIPGGAGDSAVLTVQALGRYGAIPDSVLGSGTVKIGPSSAFTQVTAGISYGVPDSLIDTVRITFASSKGGAANKLNSTLYVDDVTMTGVPFSVNELAAAGKLVAFYPNPATNVLHLEAKGNDLLTCHLVTVTGQVVQSKTFAGNATLDLSAVPAGFYFYSITDGNGNIFQSGNVSVTK